MSLIINLIQAEFEHILNQAEQRRLEVDDVAFPVSVELFDALDSLPMLALRDVVAIYLYGSDVTLSDFEVARCWADAIGWDGVELLHQDEDLHQVLRAGFSRLRAEAYVTWGLVGP